MKLSEGLAIVLGVIATILIVMSVAVYLGYWPTTLTDNLTYGELGVIAFFAIVGAIGAYTYGNKKD